MNVAFTVPGRIGGKGRPRFSARGGKPHAFTDAKTVATEAMIRQFAAQTMKGRAPLDGPLMLCINIYQAVPASWSKKKRAGAFYLTGRPDADNVAKAIADSCNGIVYGDDAQISDLRVMRRYSADGTERVEIEIVPMVEPEWLPRKVQNRSAA